MNCETIASILDDHRAVRLASPERRDVDAHLRSCDRCVEAWSIHHVLASERFEAPPPALFERLAGGLDVVEAAPMRATAVRGRWLSPALAATALLVMAVTIANLPDPRRDVEIADAAPIVAPAPAPTVTAPVAATPRAAPTFTAGRDYELAGRGSLPATSGGRVQVVEFFWWGCTPCYAFESELLRWKETVEPRIEVVKIPVAWNPAAELHARAYYTAEALGRLDVIQGPFFEEIHRGGNALASAGALAKLFARFGVDVTLFDATFNSSGVTAQVEQAKALAREYGITATPSLVIGGRYLTTPTLAGSPARLFAVVDELADTCEQTLCELLERATAPTREPGRETLDQLRDRAQTPARGDPAL